MSVILLARPGPESPRRRGPMLGAHHLDALMALDHPTRGLPWAAFFAQDCGTHNLVYSRRGLDAEPLRARRVTPAWA